MQVKGSAWGLGSSVEDVNSSLRLGRDGRPADSSSRKKLNLLTREHKNQKIFNKYSKARSEGILKNAVVNILPKQYS